MSLAMAGVVQVPAIDMIFSEFSVVGTLVGNYSELSALMILGGPRTSKTHYS